MAFEAKWHDRGKALMLRLEQTLPSSHDFEGVEPYLRMEGDQFDSKLWVYTLACRDTAGKIYMSNSFRLSQ